MICIEGNIGAGKSALLAALKARGYTTRAEPVEAWTLLERYYTDPARFGFALQAQVIASYGAASAETFSERSARASVQVFAKMLHDDGKLSALQLGILCALVQEMPIERPDTILYLELPPERCLQRIAGRGRAGEGAIDAGYLARVEACYEAFLAECQEEGTRIVRLPCGDCTIDELAELVIRTLGSLVGRSPR